MLQTPLITHVMSGVMCYENATGYDSVDVGRPENRVRYPISEHRGTVQVLQADSNPLSSFPVTSRLKMLGIARLSV